MCGIAGFWRPNHPLGRSVAGRIGEQMADAIQHRGPDDHGVEVLPNGGPTFSHRRLSILDLSQAGHQPLTSSDKRWTLVYNGEWYDHADQREKLPNKNWRGSSDSETLVEFLSAFGVEKTLANMNGMFAFGAWDAKERILHLVRDRFGIKPMFVGRQNGLIVFGSELKALLAHDEWSPAIDPLAVRAYLTLNYVPHPLCILSDVEKLSPGYRLEIREDGSERRVQWYDLSLPRIKDSRISGNDAVSLIESTLESAVAKRMLSDVPLGCLLSGGIDSSLVAHFMQRASKQPIRTFSIGFTESQFDESGYARNVAEHLGTEHTEWLVDPELALEQIPKMVKMYSEPLGDASQIPTHLVSSMAREHVSVVLGGDGGDEVFAGYRRYPHALGFRGPFRGPLSPLRHIASWTFRLIPPGAWDVILGWLPRGMRPRYPGDWVHRWAHRLQSRDPVHAHASLVEYWNSPRYSSLGMKRGSQQQLIDADPGVGYASLDRMQAVDIRTWMVDDILTKVDIASMAVGLEVRVPFLDHEVVESAFQLSPSSRLGSGNVKKLVLKQILQRHFPKGMFERPKQGFELPIEIWLRGPLRDWAESLLTKNRLEGVGITDPLPFLKLVKRHMDGRGEYATAIWSLLTLIAWKDHWFSDIAVKPIPSVGPHSIETNT